MIQLRWWKRLWRRSLTRSLKRPPWGLPEVGGTLQQVDCSRRRFLGRGQEIHVCTINKSVHTKKSLETYRMHLVSNKWFGYRVEGWLFIELISFTFVIFGIIYLISSSSSSCRAASTVILDPLSLLLPIVHRLWQVFRTTSLILTELQYVCSSWSSCFCAAICGGP